MSGSELDQLSTKVYEDLDNLITRANNLENRFDSLLAIVSRILCRELDRSDSDIEIVRTLEE